MVINDKTFYFTPGSDEEQELQKMRDIATRESGQAQFAKQGLCLGLICCVILMNYLMPTASRKSKIGIELCSALYWCIEICFLCVCGGITYVAVRISAAE